MFVFTFLKNEPILLLKKNDKRYFFRLFVFRFVFLQNFQFSVVSVICPTHHLSYISFVLHLIFPLHHLSYTSFSLHIICPTHHLSYTSFVPTSSICMGATLFGMRCLYQFSPYRRNR